MSKNGIEINEELLDGMPKNVRGTIDKFCGMKVEKVNLSAKIKNLEIDEETLEAILFISKVSGVDAGTIINEAIIDSGIIKAYQEAKKLSKKSKKCEDKNEESKGE